MNKQVYLFQAFLCEGIMVLQLRIEIILRLIILVALPGDSRVVQ